MLFLLGAGSSVDSGLPTYRGPSGLYKSNDVIEKCLSVNLLTSGMEDMWNFLRPLYETIASHQIPGHTYQVIRQLIEKVGESKCFIATQNIDGLAKHISTNVLELHGNWSTVSCLKCFKRSPFDSTFLCECGGWKRPDIVLYGEEIVQEKCRPLFCWIKKVHPKYVVVIGTSLQFGYLRKIIQKAKSKGAKVIHVNPIEEHGPNGNEEWIKSIDELIKSLSF